MGKDLSEMYLTLDCDHSIGMTVVGTSIDMWAFNYITSSSISLIEGAVMNASTNGTFSSITMDIINAYLSNSTSLKVFLENGSLIEESGNEFLIVDPETGIVRDINTSTNVCGIVNYIWGDIQRERWILEHWGETVTQVTVSLLQVLSDVINGAEHFNLKKALCDFTAAVSISGGASSITLGALIMAGVVAPPAAPIVGAAVLGLGVVGVIGGIADANSMKNDPWYTNVPIWQQNYLNL